MKRFLSLLTWLPLLFLCLPNSGDSAPSADKTLASVYGSHITACTATAVASTNANRSGPYKAGALYLIYGYTSATDFTGIGIKCIQGGSSVTVASQEGKKLAAGEKQVWTFPAGNLYISCQTGSGSGYYDVCLME